MQHMCKYQDFKCFVSGKYYLIKHQGSAEFLYNDIDTDR